LGVGCKADELALQKITVVKSKEVKTGWYNSGQNRQAWQYLLKKAMI
jgi:hypothetical protein